MVDRILFLVNATSAIGHRKPAVESLYRALQTHLPVGVETTMILAEGHPQVKAATRSAGKQLPGKEMLQIAPLRMGSGNVLAKQFGAPVDPGKGLEEIGKRLKENYTVPCCIMRCDVDLDQTHFAATLGGFGQFGNIPGDLAKWHARFPKAHRWVAKAFGIERMTQLEYILDLIARTIWCGIQPETAELIRVSANGHPLTIRLLMGAAINFPFPSLPFDPGVRAFEPLISLNLIPLGRWFSPFKHLISTIRRKASWPQLQISESDVVEIRLLDRREAGFFLDENPMVFHHRLRIQVAGTLAFVPGPEFDNSKK